MHVLVYPVSDTKSDEYVRYIVSCMPSSLYIYTPLLLQVQHALLIAF